MQHWPESTPKGRRIRHAYGQVSLIGARSPSGSQQGRRILTLERPLAFPASPQDWGDVRDCRTAAQNDTLTPASSVYS